MIEKKRWKTDRDGMKTDRVLQGGLKLPAGLQMLFVVFYLMLVTMPASAAEKQQAVDQPPTGEEIDRSVDATSRYSLDEAIDLARQRIMADPSSVQAQVTLGNLLLKKGSLVEAEKAFDSALSLNARYHEALTGKGIVLARMGKDQAAEELLQRALILNPNPVRTYYELGLLYEKKGDLAKAIIEYKEGIEKYKQGRK